MVGKIPTMVMAMMVVILATTMVATVVAELVNSRSGLSVLFVKGKDRCFVCTLENILEIFCTL